MITPPDLPEAPWALLLSFGFAVDCLVALWLLCDDDDPQPDPEGDPRSER